MKLLRSLVIILVFGAVLIGCSHHATLADLPPPLASDDIKLGPFSQVPDPVDVAFLESSAELESFGDELLIAHGNYRFSPLPNTDLNENISLNHSVSRINDPTKVGTKRERERRGDAIIRSFYANDDYQFQYRATGNYGAAEAFERKAGNCVAFSALVIRLARDQGLNASFQIVETLPVWDEVDSGTVKYIRHINAHIRTSSSDSINVDINSPRDSVTVRSRIISDREAEAEFLNNLAVEAMANENYLRSYQLLYHSLSLNDTSGGAWSNLGTLYRRMGHDGWAEQAFLKGAFATYDMETAQSNLERFYRQRNQLRYAQTLEVLLTDYREKNPLTHQRRARTAMVEGHFIEAIDHLKVAFDLAPDMPSTLYLLAINYEFLGDLETATNVQRAARLVSNRGDSERFARKRAALLSFHSQ